MVKRVDSLTEAQQARFTEWGDKWIEAGLRTGKADRLRFEVAAQECYRHAKIPWHNNVVWVSSPLVLALAAPIASLLIQWRRTGVMSRDAVDGAVGGAVDGAVGGAVRDAVDGAVDGAVRDAVDGAVRDAVDGAVGGAVDGAVRDAVRGAVGGAVRDAVDGAVGGAVDGAVRDAVRDAVRGAVRDAVDGAVRDAVRGDVIRKAISDVIARGWPYYLGGQFWAGGWGWGAAYTSFFREVCGLELQGDLWDRGRAYEATVQSACWWYPHRDFLMVCERPQEIHRELANPAMTRGWGSHRLHRTDGPAVRWGDGWGVYAIHGRLVPGWIIDHPERITVARIEKEANAEVRRVMIERYGWTRYIADCGAQVVDTVAMDHDIVGLRGARLLSKVLDGEPEPIVYLDMINSTPEPDGTYKHYLERVDPKQYDGDAGRLCHAAMASRWRYRDGNGALQLTFRRWQDYQPTAES